MKVWILRDVENPQGNNSVLGVYITEEDGKLALANYILSTEGVISDYIELFEAEVLEGGEFYGHS